MKNFLKIKNKGSLVFFLFVIFSFYIGHQFAKEGTVLEDVSVLSQAQEQFLNINNVVDEIQLDTHTSFLETLQSEGNQFYREPREIDAQVRAYTKRADPFDINSKAVIEETEPDEYEKDATPEVEEEPENKTTPEVEEEPENEATPEVKEEPTDEKEESESNEE